MSVHALWCVTLGVGAVFLINVVKGNYAAADLLAAVTFGLAATCAALMIRDRLRSGRW